MTENPLDPRRKAIEEDYFRKQNAELAAKLKARTSMQAAGVQDKELADRLLAAGFTEDSVRALYLVPVVDVAWADGRISPEEKTEIMKIAEGRGIKRDSAAFKMVLNWIEAKPTDENYKRAKSLVDPLLEGLGAEGGDWLLAAAQRVAEATGGVFGFGVKVTHDEKTVLTKLATKLKK